MSSSEGPLGYWLRKGWVIMADLGLYLEPWWQHSHTQKTRLPKEEREAQEHSELLPPGVGDRIEKGNQRADDICTYVRATANEFCDFGEALIPGKAFWGSQTGNVKFGNVRNR